ncbi:MAG TPA: DUF1343 domain-containing protein [Gemmatimonadales bacterium]|nr:DUF1343 domain-containing protein [Gemmatimonadales bacterium]
MHRRLALGFVLGVAGACVPASAARVERPDRPAASVLPGIDVLLRDSLRLVRGRRVGLVTNQGGVDARGVSDVARLRSAGVRLVALFSPEHGFRGAAEPGAVVASTVDSATGLPIYSLYGAVTAPTAEMLQGVDLLLVDLQDAGARYYTYIGTTIDVMAAAAPRRIPVVVLDRPDPIGDPVQGNVLDPAFTSPVGRLPVPMRHGLTIGELARLARAELGLATALTVVPLAGWRRSLIWDETGLPFVAPSPNLRTLEALLHYPGLCLFEGTALSVGRGTDAPFEAIGAPWLDTAAVLRRVRDAAPPGVRFRGTSFTPRAPGDGKFADTLVAAIRLEVTDHRSYDPVRTAVILLAVVQAVHPDRIGWIARHFDRLAGGPALREALSAGRAPEEIVGGWAGELAAFRERRKPYLLYPE